MTERILLEAELDGDVGRNIVAFCTNGFTNEAHGTNHCAHWAAHKTGIAVGRTCRGMSGAPIGPGGTLRVNVFYNACAQRGPWGELPMPLIYSFIFATQRTNMARDGTMLESPDKHMGIWRNGFVWNYSTMARQVLKETVPEFLARLDGVYNAGGTNPVLLFHGREVP